MKCPKCGSHNQNGNFCSNCANPLKEKCPGCGKMEPIGRPVCETRIDALELELMEKLNAISIRGKIFLPILAFYLGFTELILPMTVWEDKISTSVMPPWLGGLITMALSLLWINLKFKRWERLRKETKEKFFALHPKYNGILRVL